jgi:hypothetical protein
MSFFGRSWQTHYFRSMQSSRGAIHGRGVFWERLIGNPEVGNQTVLKFQVVRQAAEIGTSRSAHTTASGGSLIECHVKLPARRYRSVPIFYATLADERVLLM